MTHQFDPVEHPRGHPDNRGGFSLKKQSPPEGVLGAGAAEWPSIGGEPQRWVSKTQPDALARRHDGAYVSAVPPFIADRSVALPADVIALADEASEALVRFDSSLAGEVAPFAALLLRSEAAASSQIENLTASARSILTAELGETTRQNAKMIASNTKAMAAAIDLADELTTESVLAMHRILLDGDSNHVAGAWREEPVWIGTSGLSPLGADYVAPDSRRVAALMEDVMRFARRDDLPRLAMTAIAHAQFETIHPFTDGNGRTGRALMQAMLRGKGLTRNVTVPVSAGLLADTKAYHAALTSYRAGELTPIVEMTAEASFRAVQNATQLVQEVRDVQAGWKSSVRARRDSAVWKVLDLVARQPVMNAQSVAAHLGVTPTNAYPFLRSLTDAGILKAKAEYRMGTLWRSDDILGALDRFAERAGRRTRS
jgi:Fic family protein